MRNYSKLAALAALLLLVRVQPAPAQISLDVEGGLAFPGYNDVRIPGDAGTSVSFTSDLSTDRTPYARIRVLYAPWERHTFAVLVAPLKVNATGSVPVAVRFQDVTFAPATPLEASYKFNSYRLTYRYDLVRSESLEFGVGLTGKIRDAAISMSGSGKNSTKTNVGFVPLINIRLDWQIGGRFGILLDGDALAAPQGRAEDVLAALTYSPSSAYTLRLGYRILEGGADNDEVYNFALFHYAAAGVSIRL